MDRRSFLQSAALVPLLRPLGAQDSAARGRVVVVGAGLAGLAAADELVRLGYDVVVLEARTRPGGRVLTLREQFSDGLYADAGAARIQDTHAFTLRYVKRFGLALDPFFPTEGERVIRVAGRRLVGAPNLGEIPLDFTAQERQAGLAGCLQRYVFAHLASLGDLEGGNWGARDVTHLETPIEEFCRRQGASRAFVTMLTPGHDLEGMSALYFLRDLGLGAQTKVWFKIRGGNDRLPRALADTLVDRIAYGAAVTRIEQSPTSVTVTYRQGADVKTLLARFLVCTVPPAVLRRVEIRGLSRPKLQAILDVNGLPMARVFLETRRRFWLERGESGWGVTDDPIDVWDYTRGQPGNRGILGAYTSGRMAHTITGLPPTERPAFVLRMMEALHPGSREAFEAGASHSWVDDPWALGAAAAFGPGQLSRHYDALRAPEGRIHFAGEHTSPWSGWMNGGLESGLRAATEIDARAR